MTDPVARKIEQLRLGLHPLGIGRMRSGWLVLNETQPVRGCCQLLADPIVPSLNVLDDPDRASYLLDTVRIGDALLATLGAARINYETWANLAPSLHTHIVPRYPTEPDRERTLPVCLAYDPATAPRADATSDAALMHALRDWLLTRGAIR